MESDEVIREALVMSLDAMRSTGPRSLPKRVQMEADLAGSQLEDPLAAVAAAIASEAAGGPLHGRLRQDLALWDAAESGAWVGATAPKSVARREHVYDQLELPVTVRDNWTELFPVATAGDDVVISSEFEAWYSDSLVDRPSFYWDHYERYLVGKGWNADAVAALGQATTRVVERLADPERQAAYQAKGLVVGYVQSGKTANFTGVLARAIDAGYRLIIVLTGTTDLLRGQTQRRLDKELVGRENLLRGVNPDDSEALQAVDYYGDPDWDAFVSHGDTPSNLGRPDIRRLTTTDDDYRALKQGIEALDFQRIDPAKALNASVNLRNLPARLAVVKKNSTVLKRLVQDLSKITARLGDIPALIVDDESDQASLNTSNPARWKQGQKERSKINEHISDLLRQLPRSQYVGYTATPFANVFVDPSDAKDIFPGSFILSLDRPPGYMGSRDFHDLDGTPDPSTFATSNEKAFVRDVIEDESRDSLSDAIDSFVLAGALKLFRADAGDGIDVTHHTMLVHEAVTQISHREVAADISKIWSGGWMSARVSKRLEELYEADFLPVMLARADGAAIPSSFSEVKAFIGQAASRISGTDNKPVWIVNGDKEVAENNIDFGARGIWKILVGGTKLSRGFTIEGLTVSYYVRLTTQADTLMQMGRWFGFRAGYRDLVRLYIGRAAAAGKQQRDIYDAFEAACRSEEMFREEIRKYAKLVDGRPQITPADVPPLVAQHVPWLKPTAPSKMYNAVLVERRSPGDRIEPTGYPSDPKTVAHNAYAMGPLLLAATTHGKFQISSRTSFPAFYGAVPHALLVSVLEKLRWLPEDHFKPDLAWLAGLKPGKIDDWIVVLPQLVSDQANRDILGLSRSVHERSRRADRSLFGGIADPKHRQTVSRLASNDDAGVDTLAQSLQRPRRGALLIYPVFETTEKQPHLLESVDFTRLIMGLVIAAPTSTGTPGQPLVRFVTRDPTTDSAIVDA